MTLAVNIFKLLESINNKIHIILCPKLVKKSKKVLPVYILPNLEHKQSGKMMVIIMLTW